MPIELVIFDLGRVLIRICDGWPDACKRTGIAPPAIPTDEKSHATFMQIVGRYDSGKTDLRTFAREVAAMGHFTEDQVVQLQNAYLLGAFPGVDELLAEISQLGLATACLSNTAEPHWSMVHEKGGPNELPMHLLTHKFASHLIGHHKPTAAIYEHVERETGVQPGNILFFDDLEENVAAARQRGWHAHRIEIGPDPIKQMRIVLRQNGVAVAP